MPETTGEAPFEPPSTTWGRVWGAFALMGLIGLASLFAFPPLALIVIFLLGPALIGYVFSGSNRDRSTFSANGAAAAAGGAAAGALWVATHPGDAHPMAVIVSIFVTFLVMGVIGALVVWLASLRLPAEG